MLEETKLAAEAWDSWITAKRQLVNVAVAYLRFGTRVKLEDLVVAKKHGTVGEGDITHEEDILMAVEVPIIRGPDIHLFGRSKKRILGPRDDPISSLLGFL